MAMTIVAQLRQKRDAATSIQSACRGRLVRLEHQRQADAAVVIQSAARSLKDQKAFRRKQLELAEQREALRQKELALAEQRETPEESDHMVEWEDFSEREVDADEADEINSVHGVAAAKTQSVRSQSREAEVERSQSKGSKSRVPAENDE